MEITKAFWLTPNSSSSPPPYHLAIEILRTLPGYWDPYQKLDCLILMRQAIFKCITDHYSDDYSTMPIMFSLPLPLPLSSSLSLSHISHISLIFLSLSLSPVSLPLSLSRISRISLYLTLLLLWWNQSGTQMI